MRSVEKIFQNASDKPAFSNGASWEIWSSKWCEECRNDVNHDCPIVLAAFMDRTPVEWVEVGLQNYECTEFEPLEEAA